MSAHVIVIKFGGTSLGTPARIRRAAARVCAQIRRGRKPVVVVSATGHVTDRILRWVHGVAPADSALAGREIDRALATGEELSAALVATALLSRGVRAISFRGGEAGIEGDGVFSAGKIRRIDAGRLLRMVDDGIVPVVAGFQAERPDGETVTLGRGGSDTSAVALAAALGVVPCHIVTDVDAVYDRDPHVDDDARPYAHLTHDALVALVEAGARVVHPDAARLASASRVPLRVYHFRAPLSGRGGTRVGELAGTYPAPEVTR